MDDVEAWEEAERDRSCIIWRSACCALTGPFVSGLVLAKVSVRGRRIVDAGSKFPRRGSRGCVIFDTFATLSIPMDKKA